VDFGFSDVKVMVANVVGGGVRGGKEDIVWRLWLSWLLAGSGGMCGKGAGDEKLPLWEKAETTKYGKRRGGVFP
jgi:hypothetical protein